MRKNLIKEHVNRVNTPTWVACNDDARSSIWRQQFINDFGGEFVKQRHWTWQEVQKPIEKKKTVVPNTKFFVFLKENATVKVHNMTDFCRKNDYSRAAMYEVINGKRKSYKGHTYVGEVFEDLIIEE
jgi:hypothetical protein